MITTAIIRNSIPHTNRQFIQISGLGSAIGVAVVDVADDGVALGVGTTVHVHIFVPLTRPAQ